MICLIGMTKAPTTRRALLALSGIAVAAPLSGSVQAQNEDRSPNPEQPLSGLWVDFESAVVPPGVTFIRSIGYCAPGVGCASYVRDDDQTPGKISAARRRSANGVWFKLSEPVVTPLMFGALANARHDDTKAIQDALDWAEARRGGVFLSAGHYLISTSLRLPNFVTIEGVRAGSILDNQNQPLIGAQLVNKDPGSFLFATVRNLVLRGGDFGMRIDVTGEVAGLVFENVAFELHKRANFQVNKLLQTSKFLSCVFDSAPQGLVVQEPTANMNTFVGCDFTNHSGAHLVLRSGEVNNFIGCRFEGGGVADGITIDVEDVRNLTFSGCYFEATHPYLLVERRSSNGVNFENCHFTGAKHGDGFGPFRFQSDGVVCFGSNSWGQPSDGPDRMRLTGDNGGMLGGANALFFGDSLQCGGFTSRSVDLAKAGSRIPLVVFRRKSDRGGLKTLTARLSLSFVGFDSTGASRTFSEVYRLVVSSALTPELRFQMTAESRCNDPGPLTLVLAEKTTRSGADLVVEARFSGVNTNRPSAFKWTISFEAVGNQPLDRIEILLP